MPLVPRKKAPWPCVTITNLTDAIFYISLDLYNNGRMSIALAPSGEDGASVDVYNINFADKRTYDTVKNFVKNGKISVVLKESLDTVFPT